MNMQDVLQLTSATLFIPELKAKNKQDALAEMVETLVGGSPADDRDTLLQMFLNREQLGSTAVGPGVAFPHGRSLAAQDLIILLARSSKGIAFDSVDGEPTHLFFMLVAPPQDTGNRYIRALAVLTEKLQDASLREAALAAEDYEGFCKVLNEEDA